jgi:hypothetical protein
MQTQSGTSTPISTTMATLGKPASNPLGIGTAAKKGTGGDAFADLLGGSAAAAKKAATQTKGVSLADMQRQKASAGIWGSGSAAPMQQQQQQQQGTGGTQQRLGGGLDDLLGWSNGVRNSEDMFLEGKFGGGRLKIGRRWYFGWFSLSWCLSAGGAAVWF